MDVLDKLRWVTTSPVGSARFMDEDDEARKLTTKQWNTKLTKRDGKITIVQPYAYLDDRIMGLEFGRSTEIAANSTVREILTVIKSMTSNKGKNAMYDSVSFAGLKKLRNNSYEAIIDS